MSAVEDDEASDRLDRPGGGDRRLTGVARAKVTISVLTRLPVLPMICLPAFDPDFGEER